MRLLLAEDEKDLSKALCAILKHNNYSVDPVYNGEDAYDYGMSENYDGIILDLMMPKMNGIDVLKKLLKNGISTPVLILTAKAQTEDKILGLDSGADDYLTKPFSVEELLARLRVTQRRLSIMTAEMLTSNSVFVNGRLKVDYAGGCAYLDGQELHLTPIEYNILRLLMKNLGRVYSTAQIYEQVWNDPALGSENTVAVHIRHLREKIEIDPANPRYLKVVWGLGYKMEKMS